MEERQSPPSRGFFDALHGRPALVAAAAFIAGVFAHSHLPHYAGLWLGTLPLAILAALLLHRRGNLCALLIAMGLFLAGLTLAQLEAFFYPRNHIAAFLSEAPRRAELELVIDQPPRILNATWNHGRQRQVFEATVSRVLTRNGWTSCSGTISVNIAEPNPELAANQRIRVLGMLQRPEEAINPGQFNFADYYREHRTLAVVRVSRARNVQILAHDHPTLLQLARLKAREALEAGFDRAQSLDKALLRALILGDSDPELRDVQEEFRQTGTGHHLAISGMHVAVVGAVVWGICRLLRLRPRRAVLIALAVTLVYGSVALPSPPVVRSVLLCVAFSLGLLQRRITDGVQLLALSVLAMLIYHPLDLYNVGFQLSCGTVLGLMVLATPAARFFDRFENLDQRVLDTFYPPAGLRAVRKTLRRMGGATLATGAVAWAVSAPLIAYHFQQLNPWAILGSIALAPVVFLAIVGGVAKILLSLLLPMLTGLWADITVWPIVWMRNMVHWLTWLPRSDVPLPPPSLWLVGIYYALLVMPVIHRPTWRLDRLARWTPLPAAIGMVLYVALAAPASNQGKMRLTLLAVGSGQCCVVETPKNNVAVFDAGAIGSPNVFNLHMAPLFRQRTIRHLEQLFLSHPNYDHFSAAQNLLEKFHVGQVLLGSAFASQAAGNAAAEELLETIKAADKTPRILARGDTVQLDSQTSVEVLWPPPDRVLKPNDSSLVLRLVCGQHSVLFTGDIQEEAEESLLGEPDRLRSDVLIAPHHGSSELTTEAFIQAVNPRLILVSSDRMLTAKQRNFEKLCQGRKFYRTSQDGAITVFIDPAGKMTLRPFK